MSGGWVGIAHLLTPRQAADRLGVSTWTVARLRRDGNLPAVRVGGSWRYHPADLAEYITSNRSNE